VSIIWERIPPRTPIRRKLAIAAWEQSTNPNMMGVLNVNAEPAIKFLERVNNYTINSTGIKVTLTALAGKALGLAMAKYPRTNCRLMWGKIFPNETVDISFLVAIGHEDEEGERNSPDLAQVKISKINETPLVDIARKLRVGAKELRAGKNKDFNKTKNTVQMVPGWLLKYIVSLVGWISSAAGISFPALGVNAFPFGSCIITSLGPLGIEEAFIPPTPFAHVPIYMGVCACKKVPAVVDDKIVIQTQMKLTGTVDHRIVDGAEVAKLNKYLQTVLEDPESYFKIDQEIKSSEEESTTSKKSI
jgi:pyruvate/2-oxoglutarate dehydrogenase complex dihydrolipoamide acyltransferase (E2) component